MADPIPLSIQAQEDAANAVLELILQYPDYPSDFTADNRTILYNMIGEDQSFGIFPMQGAIYIKKYVSGTFVGQFPFEIVYKSSPTRNATMLDAQKLLNNIGAWLEKCNIAFSDTRITQEEIVRTSPVFPVSQSEKETELGITLQFRYQFKAS